MAYVFMSFASPHTGKNLGCCIVEVDNPNDANQRSKDLGLMPEECNLAKGWTIENLDGEDMELDTFYTRQQMDDMGYERDEG